METNGHLSVTADFGGRQVDVEIAGSNQLWVAAGPGFALTDLWLKAAGHKVDLRVRVRRTEEGVEVIVDRGDSALGWWSAGAAPRLAVAIDAAAGTAIATASAGAERDFQEVLLGRASI